MKELESEVVEGTHLEKSPAEILALELLVTKQLLRNILGVVLLCGGLISFCFIKVFTMELLVACVFGGVLALYLSNHSRLYSLVAQIDLDWSKACFFDEEMIGSVMRLNNTFFKEVSLCLLLEPLFRHLIIQSSEASVLTTILACRWILFCLIFAKDVFYLVITGLMTSLQKSILMDLKGEDVVVQRALVNELKNQSERLEAKEDEESDSENEF